MVWTADLALSFSMAALLVGAAIAAPPDHIAITGGAPPPPAARGFATVEACWKDWLAREGYQEGKNDKDGRIVLVQHGQEIVGEPVGSPNWLTARNAMMSYAEMTARKALAETMSVTLKSSRTAAVQLLGGDDPPPALRPARESLSLSDKALTLADKALDAEIRKYDRNWTGSGATDKERQDKVATLQVQLNSAIESGTQLYASGAFTAIQCEGPSAGDPGRYAVLAGLVWTPSLQQIAEAIWNPAATAPSGEPGPSLTERFAQIAADNPDWLAYTTGARVYTDERGQRVVVGFGAVPRSSLMAADKDRARLLALAAIQRFVGEKLVAGSSLKERYERRDFTDGSATSFDNSAFAQKITLVAKDLELVGAAEVRSWRGEHPWSKAGMQTVAIAWSPAWAADSRGTAEILKSAEERMKRGGGVPDVPSAAPGGTAVPAPGGSGAAVPARPGASSSGRDF